MKLLSTILGLIAIANCDTKHTPPKDKVDTKISPTVTIDITKSKEG